MGPQDAPSQEVGTIISVDPTPVDLAKNLTTHPAPSKTPWDAYVDAARVKLAQKMGLLDNPSAMPTMAEINAMVPMEGDTFRYAKDADGNPRMATDKRGNPSVPKQHGRRKPHFSKRASAMKSAAIGVFKILFNRHKEELYKKAAEAGQSEPVGVAAADLPKLGAKASLLAMNIVNEKAAAKRRRTRNESKLQRRINRGAIPGNTNRQHYIGV